MITLTFHEPGVLARHHVGYGIDFHCLECVNRVHGWIDAMTPRGLGFASLVAAETHVHEKHGAR